MWSSPGACSSRTTRCWASRPTRSDRDQPVPGFHVGAGCLFAPADFVQAFPYDPWFYFHGEEQALAARLFTHGWDIFHVPGLPVYHLYNNADSGAPPRPMHWDPTHDTPAPAQLVGRWNSARAAAWRPCWTAQPLGAYGLGRVRSMADYAGFSGIDYAARTLAPRAFVPLGRLRSARLTAASSPSARHRSAQALALSGRLRSR